MSEEAVQKLIDGRGPKSAPFLWGFGKTAKENARF
jgi:hypothetical protein